MIKKTLRRLIQLAIIAITTLCLLEICYRYSIIEFYKPEFEALNSENLLESNTADILFFGDSFSATSKEINYIDKLRATFPDKQILNFSVPGFGVRQVNTFSEKKIEKYKPKVIVYQIYVGNDLLDVETFSNRAHVSWLKYLYRKTSNTFLSLSYLNQRATVFKPKINYRHKTMLIDSFSIVNYNKRAKEFLKINPDYIKNTILLEDEFKIKYNKWLKHIKTFISNTPKNTEIYLVFVPHCSQVNRFYQENFEALGAKFSFNNQQVDYEYFERAKKDLEKFPHVTLINPLKNFQTEDTKKNRLFFANDEHLNNHGNEALYQFLIPYL